MEIHLVIQLRFFESINLYQDAYAVGWNLNRKFLVQSPVLKEFHSRFISLKIKTNNGKAYTKQ